jgi:hypothetical protein
VRQDTGEARQFETDEMLCLGDALLRISRVCWVGDRFYVIEVNDVEAKTPSPQANATLGPRPWAMQGTPRGTGTGHERDHGQPIALLLGVIW